MTRLRTSSRSSAAFYEARQRGNGVHFHFFHHTGAMRFDCPLSDTKFTSDLFVQFATDDVFEHFPLPWGEGSKTRTKFGNMTPCLTRNAIFFHCRANGAKQTLVIYGLGEEINRAAF